MASHRANVHKKSTFHWCYVKHFINVFATSKLDKRAFLGRTKVSLSGSVVECLTPDRGAAGSSLTSITVLCP